MGDVLAGQPSIKVERDGHRGTRTRVKVRGLSSSKNVLVLLDGFPLNHAYNGDVDLTQIPLSMVQRIEITRGGSSVSYSGEAVGGTINIITNRPNQKGFVADLGTGAGRYGVKHSAGKMTARSNMGDLTYNASNEFSSGFLSNEEFQTTNHFGNYTRSFNGKGYWGGEYMFHDSRVGEANGTPIPPSDWNGHVEQVASTLFAQRTQKSQHVKAFLASPKVLGGNTYASYTKSFRTSDERETRGGTSFRHQDSHTSMWNFSWKNKIIETGFQSKEMTRQIYPERKQVVYQNDGYFLAKYSRNRWTVLEGLRWDNNSRSGSFLVPRFSAFYAPNKDWLFSATTQRAHRVPNFDELFLSSAVINNPDLKDEKSHSYDLGVSWSPSDCFNFKLTGFLIIVDDLITPSPISNRYENGGTEKSKGIETEISIKGEKRGLSAHWTVQQGKRSHPSAPNFLPSAFSPRHLLTAKLDEHLTKAITFTNEVRYQSDQFEMDNHQGVRIPDFYTWNARFSVKILSAHLYFEAENITNRRYAETVAHLTPLGGPVPSVLSPQPNRTFWTGVTIRFVN